MTINNTVYSDGFGEFLIPDNPAALTVVVLLLVTFTIWLGGLFRSAHRLKLTEGQLLELENVEPLLEARKQHATTASLEGGINEDKTFDDFIRGRKLTDEPITPIVKHLKNIFLSGWTEGRLEAGELIRHTLQQLFSLNQVFRATLATFIVFGLLGTLFGLSTSLAGLAPIIQNKVGNVTNTNDAIITGLSRLLIELKSAFAPSIWGVALTLAGIAAYSYYLRARAKPVQETLERLTLSVWIPKLFPTRSQGLLETLQKSEEQMRKNFAAAEQVAKLADDIKSGTSQFHENLGKANALTGSLSFHVPQFNYAAERLEKFATEFAGHVATLTSFQAEIKGLYELMKTDSESFRRIYGETFDKQSNALERIASLDEKNRKVIEELSMQLVGGLNKVEGALSAELRHLQGEFEGLRQPFTHTADKVAGTYESFDKNIREIIGDNLRHQQARDKEQMEALRGLNANIETLLKNIHRSNESQGEYLKTVLNALSKDRKDGKRHGASTARNSGDQPIADGLVPAAAMPGASSNVVIRFFRKFWPL